MQIQCGRPATLRVRVAAAGHQPGEQELTVDPDAPWPEVGFQLQRSVGTPQEQMTWIDARLPDGFTGPGLLSMWWTVKEHDALNTAVCRGVPVTVGGFSAPFVSPVGADGSFRLPEECRRSALCLQRQGLPAHWFVPAGEALEFTPVECGAIEGRVTGFTPGTGGFLHVVLFGKGVIRREVRVEPDGTFAIDAVPARTFWLRAGDDDFDRVEPLLRKLLALDDGEVLAQPWIGAVEVTVRAGETTRGLEVPF
jgi:hypothetical protein